MKIRQSDKILITGGGGFIGSSLILELQSSYRIICLSRGSAYSRLRKFVNKETRLVKGEITDENLLDKVVKECGIIIHLAGGGGNSACLNNPIWALKTHIEGTHLLLQKAKKHNIKKFIFASSYLTYGSAPKKHALTENEPLNPTDYYGNLKRVAERMVVDSGVNYIILRLANVYGFTKVYPRLNGGAINNFTSAALSGEDIKILSSGRQNIDYIHITDVAAGVKLILKQSKRDLLYNLGSGRALTIAKLAQIVKDVMSRKFNKKIDIKKIADISQSSHSAPLMSIARASRYLGWRPVYSLEKGIAEMIANNKKY